MKMFEYNGVYFNPEKITKITPTFKGASSVILAKPCVEIILERDYVEFMFSDNDELKKFMQKLELCLDIINIENARVG